MRNTKLWSVLLVCVLLCACVLGVLFTGASAGGTAVTLYVDAAGNDATGDGSQAAPYASVEAALADLQSRTWAGGDRAIINLNGSVATLSSTESVLFGQKTIFTQENTKLPITIKGDNKTSDILTISSQKVACANDYTFDTITLPVEQNGNSFYAGSGNISLNNVAFTTGNLTLKTPFFFGDTFTATVFEGWTDDRIAKIKSQNERGNIATSVSFGTGSDVWHSTSALPGSAIGQTSSWENADSTSIVPTDTEVAVILNGASIPKLAACYYNGAHKVALLRVVINSGVTDVIAADGNNSSTTTTIKSDVSLEMYGGSYKSGRTALIRSCYNDIFEGDVTILMEGGEMQYLQMGYSDPVIKGDAILKVGGTAKVAHTATGAGSNVEGKVENYVYGNCEINNFRGLMYNLDVTTDKVVNYVSGGKITLFTGTSYKKCDVGTVINYVTGGKIGQFYGGCISADSKCTTLENNISGTAEITRFYGGYRGTIATLTNNMKGGTITGTGELVAPDKTLTDTYYGSCFAVVTTLNNNFSGTNFTNAACVFDGTVTNVNNTISAGSISKFYGTWYAAVTNVKNEISGGTFSGGYEGTYNATGVAKVETIVSGGIFNCNFYTQWAKLGTVDAVVNTITDGTFNGKNTILGGYGGSVGSVTNTISGSPKFTGSYVYFGAGSAYWPSVVGKVENTVRGGTFTAGVRGGGVASTVTGDVVNNIEGGSFYVFFGGNENNYYQASNMLGMTEGDPTTSPYYCKSVQGTIKNTFGKEGIAEGPSFSGSVYCGDVAFSRQVAENGFGAIENVVHYLTAERDFRGGAQNNKGFATEISTKIFGGIFKANVYSADPDSYCDSVVLNIASSENAPLAIYGAVEDCTAFATENTPVKIGKATYINAQTVTGAVKLHQTEGWLTNEYFVAPVNTDFSITAEAGVFGAYEEKTETDAIILRGKVLTEVKGSTLILDDRLNVRILFDPAVVANYADYFTFAASLNGKNLTVVAEEYNYNGTTYASYVIKSLGLGQFNENVMICGDTFTNFNFSVIALADLGVTTYEGKNETAAQLFRSIADLGRKANDGECRYPLVTEAVNWTASADQAPKALDKRLDMKTMGLVMTNAIGIRLTGYTEAVDTPLEFYVNGQNVTELCNLTRSETADETSGMYHFTVEVYVNVAKMTKELNIKITDGEKDMFTMTQRVDALAEKICQAPETDGELSDYALAFIQAADSYKKAQEV